jgi:hypothetical protein
MLVVPLVCPAESVYDTMLTWRGLHATERLLPAVW